MKTEELKEIVIDPPRGWFDIRISELWQARELLFFLVWRDLKVRYKQTLLGALWAILQPLISMVIFSIIFGRLANLSSNGIPYPIFSYAALLPWQLFSRALSDASMSLVNNQSVITKIYFPRLFIPVSSVLSGLVDFSIALLVLFAMMIYYKINITWNILVLPFLVLICIIAALGIGIWLSVFNVRFRDVKHAMPFLIQVWLYATPVGYSSVLVPEEWRTLYGLNPMAGVVESFRWALLGQQVEITQMFFVSLLMVGVVFLLGLFYFQRMERTFVDII